MELRKKVADALNAQINKEFYSSYLYLSMAAYCKAQNLDGFSHWLAIQAQEEYNHAMKLYAYILERGGAVALGTIDAPPAKWGSIPAIFDDVLAHEKKITESIYDLVTLVREERDYAAEMFLRWYVEEQVEEEATADSIVKRLELIADFKGGLILLDKELSARVLSAPAPEKGQ